MCGQGASAAVRWRLVLSAPPVREQVLDEIGRWAHAYLPVLPTVDDPSDSLL